MGWTGRLRTRIARLVASGPARCPAPSVCARRDARCARRGWWRRRRNRGELEPGRWRSRTRPAPPDSRWPGAVRSPVPVAGQPRVPANSCCVPRNWRPCSPMDGSCCARLGPGRGGAVGLSAPCACRWIRLGWRARTSESGMGLTTVSRASPRKGAAGCLTRNLPETGGCRGECRIERGSGAGSHFRTRPMRMPAPRGGHRRLRAWGCRLVLCVITRCRHCHAQARRGAGGHPAAAGPARRQRFPRGIVAFPLSACRARPVPAMDVLSPRPAWPATSDAGGGVVGQGSSHAHHRRRDDRPSKVLVIMPARPPAGNRHSQAAARWRAPMCGDWRAD